MHTNLLHADQGEDAHEKKLFEIGRMALENLFDDLVRAENEDAPLAPILNPPRDDMRKKLQRHMSAMELGRERAQKDKAQGEKAVRQQAERDARASRTSRIERVRPSRQAFEDRRRKCEDRRKGRRWQEVRRHRASLLF